MIIQFIILSTPKEIEIFTPIYYNIINLFLYHFNVIIIILIVSHIKL